MDRRIFLLAAICATEPQLTHASVKKVLLAGLSDTDARNALREALSAGATAAVTQVGRAGGYWDDPAIRIPLPKPLAKLQKTLKVLGQSGLLDDVQLRMNRAAENAAPLAKDLLVSAVREMTIKDAVSIVRGGSTAGTDYLKRTATPALTVAFTPVMENALQSTGAIDYLDRAVRRNNLQSLIKTDAKTYLGGHATGLALDGLFHYIGIEEAAVRRSPAKRATALLKKVFG